MSVLQIVMLALAAIFPDPTQPRRKFDDEAECGLMQSMQAVGQLQPVRVWKEGDKYLLEDGERRWRAARRLGWKEMAAVIVAEGKPDKQKLQRQYIANAQREDLSPAEKVRAIAALMQTTGWNGAETAKHLGMSEGQVSKCSTIASGPPWILELLAEGRISLGVAYHIAAETDSQKQQELRAAALNGAKRDQIAGTAKRKREPSGNGNGKAVQRVSLALPGDRSVTVAGGNDMDGTITILEEILAKLRRLRTQGVEIATASRTFRDQLKA